MGFSSGRSPLALYHIVLMAQSRHFHRIEDPSLRNFPQPSDTRCTPLYDRMGYFVTGEVQALTYIMADSFYVPSQFICILAGDIHENAILQIPAKCRKNMLFLCI